MVSQTTTVPIPKLKLVHTAAELVYRQGWNGTGINQILTEAKVPKGSFYYYFHSKEELGVAIIEHHAQQYEGIFEETLLNEDLTGLQSLLAYFEVQRKMLSAEGWRWGCPIGSFANEVADTAEKIATACAAVINRFHDVLAQAIARGQKDGSIRSTRNAHELALGVSAIWQGAVLCTKTAHSEKSIDAGVRLAKEILTLSLN